MSRNQLLTGSGSLLRKFKLWSRGYVIKKSFLTDLECQKIREYTMTLNWPKGATGLPLGSYCTHVARGHKYGFYKNLEESFFKRGCQYVLMKYLLPEKLFPDFIVQLAHGFYPCSEFDYLRVLAKRNK